MAADGQLTTDPAGRYRPADTPGTPAPESVPAVPGVPEPLPTCADADDERGHGPGTGVPGVPVRPVRQRGRPAQPRRSGARRPWCLRRVRPPDPLARHERPLPQQALHQVRLPRLHRPGDMPMTRKTPSARGRPNNSCQSRRRPTASTPPCGSSAAWWPNAASSSSRSADTYGSANPRWPTSSRRGRSRRSPPPPAAQLEGSGLTWPTRTATADSATLRKLPSGRYQIRYPGPDGQTRHRPGNLRAQGRCRAGARAHRGGSVIG